MRLALAFVHFTVYNWHGLYSYLHPMGLVQKTAFGAFALLVTAEQAFAAIDFGGGRVSSNIKGTDDTADTAVQRLVANAMIFLGIVAVLYGLWGGFKVLTAGGKDDGVKEGKKILINAGLGLIVIFLANSVIQFVLSQILR